MRIEALSTLVAVVWLTAVLCPRLAAANNLTSHNSFRKSKEHFYREHFSHPAPQTEELEYPNKRMTLRELDHYLHKEGMMHKDIGHPIECCPVTVHMVEPLGGRNRRNMLVKLFRNGDITQRFFEYSCRQDVVDKPCRFIDWRLSNRSRCVQRFAYAYAIVTNITIEEEDDDKLFEYDPRYDYYDTNTEWSLDYIKMRSGCSCEIEQRPPKKKREEEERRKKKTASKARKAKSKLHRPRDQEVVLET